MFSELHREPPRMIIPNDRWATIAGALGLTVRELEIVQQLFGGASETETGRALGISAHTVHTHLGRVYRKLNVHGCSGLFLRIFDAYISGSGSKEASVALPDGVPASARYSSHR